MENVPVGHEEPTPKSPRRSRHWLIRRLFVVIVILVVVALGWLLISVLANTTAKNNSTTEKILTINDLDNPDVELDSETSDATVENLSKELKAKIDTQILAKENPIETVNQLAGVLANTTNKTRQDQLAGFLEDFLAKHDDALRFKADSEMPDKAQINYWKAELYAKLVYNYQFMMLNGFTGSDGKPIDTTKEQVKYIELYLALANDPASHPPIPEEDRGIFVGYVYNEANDFLELKNSLSEGRATQ